MSAVELLHGPEGVIACSCASGNEIQLNVVARYEGEERTGVHNISTLQMYDADGCGISQLSVGYSGSSLQCRHPFLVLPKAHSTPLGGHHNPESHQIHKIPCPPQHAVQCIIDGPMLLSVDDCDGSVHVELLQPATRENLAAPHLRMVVQVNAQENADINSCSSSSRLELQQACCTPVLGSSMCTVRVLRHAGTDAGTELGTGAETAAPIPMAVTFDTRQVYNYLHACRGTDCTSPHSAYASGPAAEYLQGLQVRSPALSASVGSLSGISGAGGVECKFEEFTRDTCAEPTLTTKNSEAARRTKPKGKGEAEGKGAKVMADGGASALHAVHTALVPPLYQVTLPAAACTAAHLVALCAPRLAFCSSYKSSSSSNSSNNSDSSGVAMVTCSPSGCLSTYDRSHSVLRSKSLPLNPAGSGTTQTTTSSSTVNPCEAYSMHILPSASAYDSNAESHEQSALLAVFCSKQGLDGTVKAKPFALLFRLHSLELVCEVQGARVCSVGYYCNPAQKSILWGNPQLGELRDNDRYPVMCLTSFPAEDGTFSVLHYYPPEDKDSEEGGAVVGNASMQPGWKEKCAAGVVNLDVKSGTQKKKRKGKGKDKGATNTTSTAAAALKKKRKRTAQETEASTSTSTSAVVRDSTFDTLPHAQKQSVLTALQTRLIALKRTSQAMQEAQRHRHQELHALHCTTFALLQGHQEKASFALHSIASHHKPLFGSGSDTQSDEVQLQVNEQTKKPQSLRNKSCVADVRLLDALCLCNERTYTVLVIVRAFNPSVLPVFDLQVLCTSAQRESTGGTGEEVGERATPFTPLLLCVTSATASFVRPHEEVWLSAQIPLSPAMFMKTRSSMHDNHSLAEPQLSLNISLQWKDIQKNVAHAPQESLQPAAYRSAALVLARTMLQDEFRAVLEVKNQWLPSDHKGVVGASLDLRQEHMSAVGFIPTERVSINAGRKRNGPRTPSPHHANAAFIEARTFADERSSSHSSSSSSSSNSSSSSSDISWAKRTLQGWLNGRALQRKPMPSSMSSWTATPGGVCYYSHLSGIDIQIQTQMSGVQGLSTDREGSEERLMEWLDKQSEAGSRGGTSLTLLRSSDHDRASDRQSSDSNPNLCQDEINVDDSNSNILDTNADTASLRYEDDRKKAQFLRLLPELEEYGQMYSGRLLVEDSNLCRSGDGGSDSEQQMPALVPGRIVAPILPHGHTAGIGIGSSIGQWSCASHSQLTLSILTLQYQLCAAKLRLVPVFDTEYRLELLRLSATFLLEELKLVAVARREQRERQLLTPTRLPFPNMNTNHSNNMYHSSYSHQGLEREALELLMPDSDLYASKSLAALYRMRKLQANTVTAFALEASNIL